MHPKELPNLGFSNRSNPQMSDGEPPQAHKMVYANRERNLAFGVRLGAQGDRGSAGKAYAARQRADLASRRAAVTAPATSLDVRTIFMPIPPPPAPGLMSAG